MIQKHSGTVDLYDEYLPCVETYLW